MTDDVIESLIGLAGAAWHPGAVDVVVRAHHELAARVSRTTDTDLRLLIDALGSYATLADGRPEQAVRDAIRAYERAVDVGNIMGGWISAGPPMIVAILARDPQHGISWVNRLMRSHLRLGAGGSGPFMENRANFAALAGDFRAAVCVHAAAYIETRRSGMVWPRREATHELLELSRTQLGTSHYDQAWAEGSRWSLADVVSLDPEG